MYVGIKFHLVCSSSVFPPLSFSSCCCCCCCCKSQYGWLIYGVWYQLSWVYIRTYVNVSYNCLDVRMTPIQLSGFWLPNPQKKVTQNLYNLHVALINKYMVCAIYTDKYILPIFVSVPLSLILILNIFLAAIWHINKFSYCFCCCSCCCATYILYT